MISYVLRCRLALVCLLGAISLVCATGTSAAGLSQSQLQALIKERFPKLIIEGVYPSADLPGYYEVVTPEEIAYVDDSGTRLIMGSVMDIKSRSSLTAKRWNELHRIDYSSLPFDKAIKIVQGDGSRQLAIFEDPFCPYCAELEKSLQHLDNVTIYVFLYPLEEVHPGAIEVANELWCATDRSGAWVSWMREEKAPLKNACLSSPVAELVNLGSKLKIHATPTMFFQDGFRVAGVVSIEQINKKFEAIRANTAR